MVWLKLLKPFLRLLNSNLLYGLMATLALQGQPALAGSHTEESSTHSNGSGHDNPVQKEGVEKEKATKKVSSILNSTEGFLIFPENCQKDCVYQALEDGKIYSNSNFFVSFVTGAIAAIKKEYVEFVKGRVLIDVKSAGKEIRSEYGSFVFEKPGQAIFVRDKEKVEVFPLNTSVKMVPKGSHEKIQVNPGMSNWLSRVKANGRAQSGFPQTADLKKVIKLWGQLFAGELPEFKNNLAEYSTFWGEQIGEAADIQKSYIERRLSSIASQKRNARARRLKRKAERQKLENMFLRRSGYQQY